MKNIKVLSSNYTGSSLNIVYSDGKVRTVIIQNTNPNWARVIKAYKNKNFSEVLTLIDTPAAIERTFKGEFTVKNGKVYKGDKECHSYLAGRIIFFAKEGLPYKNLLKFAKNLEANPSERAREELYKFLEHGNFPIDDKGEVYAYKGVQNDFYSKTAGTLPLIKGKTNAQGRIYNAPGEEIECERKHVCDDKNVGCAPNSLHVGSFSYAREFSGGDGKLMIVKFNPKDCVSVPTDCNHQKLRVCRYEVISEEGRILNESKDTKFGKKVSKPLRDSSGRFLSKK